MKADLLRTPQFEIVMALFLNSFWDGRLMQLAFEFHLLESKTMKIKILITLIATAGILGLAGCKPKATTVSGQVFIVTKGAENFKLGAVEILLVEKSQVTDFLQKKQPAIESEMASKRQDITNAEQEVATAQTNEQNLQNKRRLFQSEF